MNGKYRKSMLSESEALPGCKKERKLSSFCENTTGVMVYVNSNGNITIKPSNKRLSIILSEFDDAIYDVDSNEWRICEKDYLAVRKKLKKNNFVFDDIPKGVLNVVRRTWDVREFELVGSIYDSLLSFQREGVVYALNRSGRIILADDMGLGKTIQALAIAHYYRSEWPLLIISPASLLESWAEACKTFLDIDPVIMKKGEEFCASINIASYEIVSNNASALSGMNIRVIISDECHYLKSQATKRTKKIVPLLQKASRVLLLSGTPAVSRPLELYPIISAVDRTIFPRFTEYGVRYCNGRKIGRWYDYKGCSNAEELHYILRHCLMLRRTKSEVLNQLPKKFRRKVILQSLGKQPVVSKEIIGDSVEESAVTQYKGAVSLKIDSVKQYLLMMIKKSVKFIVFCHHVEMMDGLELFLKENGIPIIRIDGSTPSSNRNSLVKEYQEKDNIKIALLSITACGIGLTLTAGRAVVFAELYWNPGTLLQAEDRVHRIGQKNSVDIIYLVAKGTIDEYVWPKLLSKLSVLESIGIGSNQLKNVGSTSSRDTMKGNLFMFNIK